MKISQFEGVLRRSTMEEEQSPSVQRFDILIFSARVSVALLLAMPPGSRGRKFYNDFFEVRPTLVSSAPFSPPLSLMVHALPVFNVKERAPFAGRRRLLSTYTTYLPAGDALVQTVERDRHSRPPPVDESRRVWSVLFVEEAPLCCTFYYFFVLGEGGEVRWSA